MSEAVRAALAARRAALKEEQQQKLRKQQQHADGFHIIAGGDALQEAFGQPTNGSGSPDLPQPDGSSTESAFIQRSEQDVLLRSCTTGRANLSSRLPAYQALPDILFTLLEGEAPCWYDQAFSNDQRRPPWYEREDLRVLSVGNSELEELDGRISEFRGLGKLELQHNALTRLPESAFQLINLTTLNLSRNGFTSIPTCLLALDSLLELDLSYNKLDTLWSDEAVLFARSSRRDWDLENADEEDGVWAGLLARAGSPTKRERPAPPSQAQKPQPMRSLRHLNLSHNRIDNAAIGLSTKSKTGASTIGFTWPPTVIDLRLNDNMLRGPMPLTFATGLRQLERLSLGGNAITDEVFMEGAKNGQQAVFGAPKIFSQLQILDLRRCEIDDLQPLERCFASGSVAFPAKDGEEAIDLKQGAGAVAQPMEGLGKRQLVRITKPEDPLPQSQDGSRLLAVIIEGNPLREENFKRKYGKPRNKAPSAEADSRPLPPSVLEPVAERDLEGSGRLPIIAPQPPQEPLSTASAIHALPERPKATATKEDWEIQIEQGHFSAAAQRRMRIEAARRQQEGTPGPNTPIAQQSPSTSKYNSPRPQAVHTSLWDEDPGTGRSGPQSPPDNMSHAMMNDILMSAATFDDSALQEQQGGAGSTLANTKLTKRTKESLAKIPCKFFRSANGCSAGEACPFAHVAPGEGTSAPKAVCDFFLKGNCRFGHKCALAHIREGEPMSMDRKNKKAAQQGQRLGKLQQVPMGMPRGYPISLGGPPQEAFGQPTMQHQTMFPPPPLPATEWPTSHAFSGSGSMAPAFASPSKAMASAADDFTFGLPDDLPPHQPSGIGRSLGDNCPPPPALPIPRSQQSGRQPSGSFIGSPSSRPFGSSPFGQSVFFSGSQDSEGGSGPFSSSGADRIRPGQGSSFGGIRNSLSRSLSGRIIEAHDSGSPGNRGFADDEDGTHNEEDFLPSSLSDLLTPAELERRKRTSAGLSLASARTSAALDNLEPVSTQSLPGAGRSGPWDLNPVRERSNQDPYSSSPSGPSGLSNSPSNAFLPVGSPVGSRFLSSANFSPNTAALAEHHTAGSSLPQGLAAGLSRMHLGAGQPRTSGQQPDSHLPFIEGQPSRRVPNQLHGNSPSTDSLESGPPALAVSQHPSPQATTFASSRAGAMTMKANERAAMSPSSRGQLDDHGLGPTAPSSVFGNTAGGRFGGLYAPGAGGAGLLSSSPLVPSSLRESTKADSSNESSPNPEAASLGIGPRGRFPPSTTDRRQPSGPVTTLHASKAAAGIGEQPSLPGTGIQFGSIASTPSIQLDASGEPHRGRSQQRGRQGEEDVRVEQHEQQQDEREDGVFELE